ncbi:MAG: hypothetical protein DRG11_02130 [Epsilonproteobacteria bacterium]|nr:MAG: hypothetical protein DRG11_02130 [Campylobacterota bacterium]
MKKVLLIVVLATLSWSVTAKQVMSKIYIKADKHKTQEFDVKMKINNKDGESKERFFTNKKQIKKVVEKV